MSAFGVANGDPLDAKFNALEATIDATKRATVVGSLGAALNTTLYGANHASV